MRRCILGRLPVRTELHKRTRHGATVAVRSLGTKATDRLVIPAASSFTEWGKLKVVVLGRISNDSYLDSELSWQRQEAAVMHDEKGELSCAHPGGFLEPRVVDEAREDLDIIHKQLEDAGVTVLRPDHTPTATFSTPSWSARTYFPYCPRDVLLTMGTTVVETPSPNRARYFETFAYKRIIEGLLDAGTPTIGPQKPRLMDEMFGGPASDGCFLAEDEPCFDAANVLRCGRDVLYQVSHSGNARGATWLQKVFPQFRVHLIRNVYTGIHLDTTFVMLRPGLFLANPDRVKDKSVLPPFLRKWKMLVPPEPVSVVNSDQPLLSSGWIGINMLQLSENLAAVCSKQVALIKMLEQHGIDVIPVTLRHAQSLGGGIKCCTLDLLREDELTDY